MKKEPILDALAVLDTQFGHCENMRNNGNQDAYHVQTAYYQGMKDILALLVSDCYTNGKDITQENGKHRIINCR